MPRTLTRHPIVFVCLVALVLASIAGVARAQDPLMSPFSPDRIHFFGGLDIGINMFNATASHRVATTVNLDAQPGIFGTVGFIWPQPFGIAYGDSITIGYHPGDFLDVDIRSMAWFLTQFVVHPKVFATFRIYDFSGNGLIGLGVGGGVGVDFTVLPFMLIGIEFQLMYLFFDTTTADGLGFELRLPIYFII